MIFKALGNLVGGVVEVAASLPGKIIDEVEEIPEAVEHVFEKLEDGIDKTLDR